MWAEYVSFVAYLITIHVPFFPFPMLSDALDVFASKVTVENSMWNEKMLGNAKNVSVI